MIWFIAGLLYAAASDARRLRVPNAGIVFLLGSFGLSAVRVQLDGNVFVARLTVAFAILVCGAMLFARGWMGGGDVKLLAVSGFWLGPDAMPAFLLLTALAGGLLAPTLIVGRTLVPHRLDDGRRVALRDPMGHVPYALAVAVAGIAVVCLRPGTLLMG